jgi:hypothetical protein
MDFELLKYCPYVEKNFILDFYECMPMLSNGYCDIENDTPDPELLPYMNREDLNKLREDYIMIAEDGIFDQKNKTPIIDN